MLSWFVDKNVPTQTMYNKIIIKEDKVKVYPKRVPMKCLNENVCINLIIKYFAYDAWN